MPLLCPGCTSPLDPAASMCQMCMRPRDRAEIFAGYRQLKKEQEERSARPRRRAGAVVLTLAVLGGGYWAVDSGALRRLAAMIPRPAAPAPPAPPPPPAWVKDSGPSAPAPIPAGAPPAAAPAPAAPAPRAEKPPNPFDAIAEEAFTWTISGELFYLKDLAPAAKVTVRLREKGEAKAYEARSNAKGRFTLKVPALQAGGYEVELLSGGKKLKYIEDPEVSYKTFDPRRRAEEAADMAQAPGILHVPILLPAGTRELRYDAALLSR